MQFGGVLDDYGVYALVQSDGTFTLTTTFPDLQQGTATAQVFDQQMLASNVATYTII